MAGAVGFAEALARAEARREGEAVRLARLQRRLAARIRAAFGDGVVFNTPLDGFHPSPHAVAPHVLSVSFPPTAGRPLDGEMLLLGLDLEGVYASAGSACTSGAVAPSHVLLALGAARETAAATVRFSLGRATDEADVDAAAASLEDVVRRIAGHGP